MDVGGIVSQQFMQAIRNLKESCTNVKNRQEGYLFANMKYGARLDCKKNPKALNNSAGKFLFPGQAHTKPEEGVKIVRIVDLFQST